MIIRISKKLISILIIFTCLFSFLPMPANAMTSGDFVYYIDGEIAYISQYTGSGGFVTIPSTLGGKQVALADNAFWGCTQITGIQIPDCITVLSTSAFYGCSNLSEVNLPAALTSIQQYAFAYCTSLTEFNVPATVVDIAYNTFLGCRNLVSITVDAANPSYTVFEGALCTINDPYVLQYPPARTGSFHVSANMIIADTAFAYNRGLTSIEVDSSNTRYSGESGLLLNKNGTTLLAVPGAMTGSFSIPEGVQYVWYYLFIETQLTAINIPASVISIEGDSLIDCPNLSAISVDPANTAFSSADGILYNKDKTRLLRCPVTKTGTYSVPASVTVLNSYAFKDCSGLNSIVLPSNLMMIGSQTFMNCSLTSINIPNTVTRIGDMAFMNCTTLDAITIPQSALVDRDPFVNCPSLHIYCFDGSSGYQYAISHNIPYVVKCNIYFDSQGGTQIASTSVVQDALLTIPANPTMTGYSFAGWYKDPNCTMPWNFSTDLVHQTIYLYAKWSAIAPPVPTGLAMQSVAYNQVRLTWTAIPAAGGYYVYRTFGDPNGAYSEGYDAKTNSYLEENIQPGEVFYCKVRAYRLNGTTKVFGPVSSIIKCMSILPAPTVPKAASAGSTSIKVSWASVWGAHGYQVYRATSSTGSYSIVSTVAASSYVSPSYTNSSLTVGKTYYYKIRAYFNRTNSITYSAYSPVVYAKPIPAVPTGLKAASVSYSRVKVAWSAVSGANGYSIYRASSATGTYALLSSTTALSYTNSGLTTGTTYYYKVKAYRLYGTTKVYGNLTAAVSARPVPSAAASFTAIRASSSSIKLSWSAVSGASRYEIWRANSSTGAYTLVKTTTSTSIIDPGLTTGHYYYYKVRAYRLVGITKVYGAYTAVKYAMPL